MSYKPLVELDSSRLPDVVDGLQREDVIVEDKERQVGHAERNCTVPLCAGLEAHHFLTIR